MNTTTALICLAVLAWLIQIIFSGVQIYRFNQAFAAMKKGTYLGMGRSSRKRFQPRVLIALSFDKDYRVIDSVIMQGLTVFAQPKPLDQLHGVKLADIVPEVIFPRRRSCQAALISALSTPSN